MFRFSLQRVLELRAQREQEAAATLAVAREEADRVREQLEALEEARAEGMERSASARGAPVTVGELHHFQLVLQHLETQLTAAQEQVEAADATLDRCKTDFTTASQDRRILDRLRERHLGEWQAAELREDRKTMDSIALAQHTRKRASKNGTTQ